MNRPAFLLSFGLFFWLALFPSTLSSQQSFWSEHFSSGIPAGWDNQDASGQGVVWTWCGNPEGSCVPIFGSQLPFQATTAADGFVLVNSDAYGDLASDHVARLTTNAIDCSSRGDVYVKFQTQIGVYQTSAESGAVLRVSTDKINWTTYTLFPGLTADIGWSDNPATPIIDITSIAAGEPTVYLQWQWAGNYEYLWSMDDVELFGENPTLPHDVAIDKFFFPAASYATPASQIAGDTFGFYAYLCNNGLQPMTNLVLQARVETMSGTVLFEDSATLPSMPAGAKDSLLTLPGFYVPALAEGKYRIVYALSADSTDLRPNDNEIVREFEVTATRFAKENGPEQATRPTDGSDWAVGNLYELRGGAFEQYKATRAEFAFATDPNELAAADMTATIYLFRVKDDVADDWSNFDDADLFSNSVIWEGESYYEAPDDVQNFQLQSATLYTHDTDQQGVLLQAGARYFIMVDYSAPNHVVYHAYNDDVPTYFVSSVIVTDSWYLGGFEGDNDNAVVRLYIDLVSTTDEKPLAESALSVYPNPASERVNLDVKFDQPTDATITLADMSGRVISMEDRNGMLNEQVSYGVSTLAPGLYLARIATKEGTLTRKFMVGR